LPPPEGAGDSVARPYASFAGRVVNLSQASQESL